MNINDTFPSSYLKASDLKGHTVAVVMDHVQMEDVGDDDQRQKPVLYFQGKEKGLVLNKTNAQTIAGMWSPETDNWPGKAIAIFPTQTDYRGTQVECIRVKIHPPVMTSQPAQPQSAAQPEQYSEPVQQTLPKDPVDDSSIPF